jgi:hypothetical protein
MREKRIRTVVNRIFNDFDSLTRSQTHDLIERELFGPETDRQRVTMQQADLFGENGHG